MTSPKALIIGGAFSEDVAEMFRIRKFAFTKVPSEADVIVFTGGADICSELYGEEPLSGTHTLPARDKAEVSIWNKNRGKKYIGICRGGQLLNVLSGGRLWQHVNNHGGRHPVYDLKKDITLELSSMHHQMMIPGAKGELLAVANQSTLYKSFKEDITRDKLTREKKDWDEAEAIFYPETKALCYQPHPEVEGTNGRNYFFELVKETLDFPEIPILRKSDNDTPGLLLPFDAEDDELDSVAAFSPVW